MCIRDRVERRYTSVETSATLRCVGEDAHTTAGLETGGTLR